MNSDAAIKWVQDNEQIIRGYLWKMQTQSLSPYDDNDFLQDAYIVALKTIKVVHDASSTRFGQVFWNKFKTAIGETVPKFCRDETKRRIRSSESQSVPSSFYIEINDVTELLEIIKGECHITHRSIVFTWISPALTHDEQKMLGLYAGFEPEGTMSIREIAEKLKTPRTTVRYRLTSAQKKINSLLRDESHKRNLQIILKLLNEQQPADLIDFAPLT